MPIFSQISELKVINIYYCCGKLITKRLKYFVIVIKKVLSSPITLNF